MDESPGKKEEVARITLKQIDLQDSEETSMKILLLGVGLQGKAALYDLVQSRGVTEIIAADKNVEALESLVARQKYGDKVRCEYLDAVDPYTVTPLMELGPDVAIELLPAQFQGDIAGAAVHYGIHLVNTFYVTEGLQVLADEARSNDVTILPEFGLDPGIDLILLGEAVQHFDKLDEIATYGAGIPEEKAADNPLKYKVSWTFKGVLDSYTRPARMIRECTVIDVPESRIFHPENLHTVDIDGVGRLEAHPNGDAIEYCNRLQIDWSQLKNMGRYTLRWPGHAAFWRTMVDLHLLGDEPVVMGDVSVDKKLFLATALQPKLQYTPGERDLSIVRVEVTGMKGGERRQAVYEIVDERDLESGLTAMSRTVGFTASIGAQMIGNGTISQRGIVSPADVVPYDLFEQELRKRNIHIRAELTKLDD